MTPVPTILAFNLSDAALAQLRGACGALGLRLKNVPKDGFPLPLGQMAGLPAAPAAAPAAEENFDDPMLVMCGLDDVALDRFLAALRALPMPPIPLKAVLTYTNAGWNALTLHQELAREHAALQGRRAKQT